MKKAITILLSNAILSLSLIGCAETSVLFSKTATPKEKALAAISIAETGLKFSVGPGVITWMSLTKDPAQQAQDANWGYAACQALYAASTGAILTPAQLRAQIALFTKNNARYQMLAQTLTSDYASIFNSFKVAQTSPAQFLSEIATLGMQAFKPYLATTPTT